MIFDTQGIEQGVLAHKRHWGEKHEERIIDQLFEEMAELQKELCKVKRGNPGLESVFLEFCDVLICLEFLGRHYGFDMNQVRERVSSVAVELSDRLGRDPR